LFNRGERNVIPTANREILSVFSRLRPHSLKHDQDNAAIFNSLLIEDWF